MEIDAQTYLDFVIPTRDLLQKQIDDFKQKIQQNRDQVKGINEQADEWQTKLDPLILQLSDLNAQIEAAQAEITPAPAPDEGSDSEDQG